MASLKHPIREAERYLQNASSQKDYKMNWVLHSAYELLHKTLGYDGVTRYSKSGRNRFVRSIDCCNSQFRIFAS